MSIRITGKVTKAKLLEQEPYDEKLHGKAMELYGYIEMETADGRKWFRTPKILRYGSQTFKFPKRGNKFLNVMQVAGDPDMLVLMVKEGDTITVDGRPKGPEQLNYVSLL